MSIVSILIPAKNAAPYLEDCLSSILSQSFTEWEVIIIDDHSADHTWNLCLQYSRLDKRIKTLKNTEKGIISALRLAFKNAKGNYITRMDADDIMSPDKLELMYTALKNSGLGNLAVGLVSYFSAQELGQGYLSYGKWLNKLTAAKRNFEEIYKECSIPSPNWMIHREDLVKCNAFNPDIYPEDYDLAFRFRRNKLNILPILQNTLLWRDHQDRSSRTDPNYSDNSFIPLKIKYFLEDDYDSSRPLVLWGAGKKGKKIAIDLIEKGIHFNWITNNPKKINTNIYKVILKSTKIIETFKNPQIIISTSQKGAQNEIREIVKNLIAKDIYFFC